MIAAESEKRDILYTHTHCVFSHLQISLSGAGDDGVIDCGVGSVSFAPGHTSTSLSLSDCFIAPSHQGKLTEDKMGGWRQEVQLLGASHKHTAAALVSTPLRFITVSSMTSPTSPNDPGSDHLLVSLNCLA